MTRAQSVPMLLAILALTACGEASDVEGFSIPIAASTFFSATGETPPPGPSRALLTAPPSLPAPPPPAARMLVPPQIRGIYVSAYAAGSRAHRSSLLALTDSTELNSWVVDVKDDDGIRYRSGDALAKEVTRGTIPLHDLKSLVDTLLAHGIYPIARVVVFKDSRLAEARPEWAIRTPSGAIWRDKLGTGWMSPWDERVWEYNLRVAEEAARAGFREIQFDYVRFPEAYQSLPKQIHAKAAGEREEAIAGFLTSAKRRLGPRGVVVAADLFGLSMNDAEDVGIGHQWETLSPVVDHLLPMVYPSHYFPTHLPGIRAPNRMPYETVFTSVAMG
nr:putative glycoside hydrolase [Gemmatimonadota bacterium]